MNTLYGIQSWRSLRNTSTTFLDPRKILRRKGRWRGSSSSYAAVTMFHCTNLFDTKSAYFFYCGLRGGGGSVLRHLYSKLSHNHHKISSYMFVNKPVEKGSSIYHSKPAPFLIFLMKRNSHKWINSILQPEKIRIHSPSLWYSGPRHTLVSISFVTHPAV